MPHIDGADAADVATTAAEGGIGYWSQIQEYRPSRYYDPNTNRPIDVPDDFVFYTIARLNDDDNGYYDDPDSLYDVTPLVINRGLRLFVEGNYKSFGFDPFDIETIDSAAADTLIQLGLFGKLI